jgi:fatty-acid desaturase
VKGFVNPYAPANTHKVPKTIFQEWCQKHRKPTPRYTVKDAPEGTGFICKVVLPDKYKPDSDVVMWMDDAQPDKEEAQQRAAVVALARVVTTLPLERLLAHQVLNLAPLMCIVCTTMTQLVTTLPLERLLAHQVLNLAPLMCIVCTTMTQLVTTLPLERLLAHQVLNLAPLMCIVCTTMTQLVTTLPLERLLAHQVLNLAPLMYVVCTITTTT